MTDEVDNGKPTSEEDVFICKMPKHDAYAEGYPTAKGFMVKRDSRISDWITDNEFEPKRYKETRIRIESNHGFVVNRVLLKDIEFGSPSEAAVFVLGNSASGLQSWKRKTDGRTLRECFHKD